MSEGTSQGNGAMKLIVTENGENREVDLTQPVLDIGRDAENGLVIKDPRSSRKHCRVRRTPQGWILEDLKSRNGTTLNGAPVAQNLLKSGDEFRIGNARFRLQDTQAPAPAPSSGRQPPAAAPKPPGSGAHKATVVLEADSPSAPSAATAPATRDDDQDSARRQPPAEFYLEGIEGAHVGKRIDITHLPFTIGRKPTNDFHLEDNRASGHHARIVERKGGWWLEDLESKNGTLLNQRKVRAAPIPRGALLKIGDSSFRLHVPSPLGPPEGTGEAEEAIPLPAPVSDSQPGEVAEDEFSHFNAREFFEAGAARSGAPMQVVAILLVLGTLLYFTVDVTLKMVRPKDPDPAAADNLVPNWSFEAGGEPAGARGAAAAIPGWSVQAGDPGSIALATEGHQYPGRQALRLTADGDGLCRAATADLHIDPAKEYRLQAHLENRRSFAAGVLVSWLAEAGGNKVEVARSWAGALTEEEGSEDLERSLKPPLSAVFARVSPFIIAAGRARGAGLFDQVLLAEKPAAEAESSPPPAAEGEEPEIEQPLPVEISDGGGEGAAAAASKGPPIRLLVADDGTVRNLRRGPRPTVQSFWLGVPPASDPLVLGQRISTRLRRSSEREGVVLSCQLPDLEKGEWRPIEARVRGQLGEILCEYRFQGEAGTPDRAALYLEPAPLVKDAVGLGGSVGLPTHFRIDQPVGGTVDELVFGNGGEQIVLLFSSPVSLSSIPHPESHGRTLLAATMEGPAEARAAPKGSESANRMLIVRISPASRREKEAVAALLAKAAESHREGRTAEARQALTDLASKFPWRAADLAQAQEMEKGWNAEGERALREIQLGLEDLTASPSPVIAEALGARVARLRKTLEGSPLEAELKGVEEKIRRLVPEKSRPGGEPADPAALLAKVKSHLEGEELGFAELCLNLARDLKLDPGQKAEADHLGAILAERRARRATEEVR